MNTFDPRQHGWRFISYYKYRFQFRCVGPRWLMSYGGEAAQIYTYSISAGPMTWAEAVEGTCSSDAEVAEAMAGDHEYVYVWRMP